MQLVWARWALIRVIVQLVLYAHFISSQTEQEQLQTTTATSTNDENEPIQDLGEQESTPVLTETDEPVTDETNFAYVWHTDHQSLSPPNLVEINDTETPALSDKVVEYQRPSCEKGKGCNKPLDCFDFSTLDRDSPIPDPPQVVKVTPFELEAILENELYENCCAIVMFYAPWCEFSVQFARRFNAIGRTFSELPVLAVDLGENEPHKYILAYLPVVVFYHRARVIYKFDISDSYEELSFQIANMTDFVAIEVDLEDEENERPVPTQRSSGGDLLMLQMAIWWLLFVLVVLVVRSRPVLNYVQQISRRFTRTKVD